MFYPLITLELMDRGETTATTGLILGLLAAEGIARAKARGV